MPDNSKKKEELKISDMSRAPCTNNQGISCKRAGFFSNHLINSGTDTIAREVLLPNVNFNDFENNINLPAMSW